MSELKVEGADLKKMVKLGRKHSLPFAFCPGPKNNHAFLIHRRKNPSMLSKLARKEGEGKKVAFGTFVVNGRNMEMTCERTVPAMAKTLKKYLKSQQALFNVIILDVDGELLESDIEDLPPDPSMDEATDVEMAEDDAQEALEQSTEAPEEVQAEDNEDTGDTPQIDAAALVARLKALQPAVGAAEAATAEKLNKAISGAIAQIKSAALEKADTTITALEAAVGRLTAASQTPPAKPVSPEVGPDFDALTARAQAVKGAIGDLAGPARDKLVEAFKSAVGDIKKRNHDAADAMLSRIETALEKLATATETPQDAPAQDAAEVYEAPRQNWIQTRSTLKQEITALKAKIDADTSGIDGLEEVAQKSSVLFDYITDINDDLELTLQDLGKSTDESERESLKAKAQQIVEAYKGVLDTDFFKAVDNNGFMKTNIRGSALASLQQVSTALAA